MTERSQPGQLPSNPSNAIELAARALIEEIRAFMPVSGYYSAIIKSRLVNALEEALEQPPAPETFEWLSMGTAPKGGGAESVADPKWGEPPHILLLFEGGKVSVAYWDWHYAEGGGGYRPGLDAWVEPCSGEQLRLHYSAPIGWMHLPRPNTQKASERRCLMRPDMPCPAKSDDDECVCPYPEAL